MCFGSFYVKYTRTHPLLCLIFTPTYAEILSVIFLRELRPKLGAQGNIHMWRDVTTETALQEAALGAKRERMEGKSTSHFLTVLSSA